MPLYGAYCPKCDRRVEYNSSIDSRDENLAKIEPCCGVPMKRQMFAPMPDVAFVPGMYDIGLGGPQRYESDAQMQKAIDNHNREAAKRGSSGLRLKRGRF